MSAGFAKFHPNLVVGGTYSGQIVLWDNRSNKRTPVQRTPLSAAAHTVMSLSLLFSHFKHGLLSGLKVIFRIVSLPSASRLLRQRGRNAKCQQPDQHFHGRQDVFLEPGHAVPAAGEWSWRFPGWEKHGPHRLRPRLLPPAGQPGTGVQAEQSGGRHLHGLPPGRRQQLRGGERGRFRVHRLSSREVRVLKAHLIICNPKHRVVFFCCCFF